VVPSPCPRARHAQACTRALRASALEACLLQDGRAAARGVPLQRDGCAAPAAVYSHLA
jgi:hypothetical protein